MFEDLHILINTIQSSSVVNSSAAASWLPICLPKFNPAAFVNAYVTFLRRKDSDTGTPAQTPIYALDQPFDVTPRQSDTSVPSTDESAPLSPVLLSGEGDQASLANDNPSRSEAASTSAPCAPSIPMDIGLICVSGMAEFEAVRTWCTVAAEVRSSPSVPRVFADLASL